MRKSTVLALGAAALLLLALPALGDGGLNQNQDYTNGPNVCGACHEQALTDWLAHGHSGKLSMGFAFGGFNNPNVGEYGQKFHPRNGGIPLPRHDEDVYNWDNILGVIGATKHWKSRFIGLDGYILTTGGKNQYNWQVGAWVDYHADEVEKPFDCGSCHTTGYDPNGTAFQDGTASVFPIPGIVGDFSHINITCEACHGPGAAHVVSQSKDDIIVGDDITAASCGACHTRGDDDSVVLASGSFIKHHEQYPELLAGAHAIFNNAFGGCNGCHEGHIGRSEGWTAVKSCETCHPTQAAEYADSSMQLNQVKCIDCHMGKATRSGMNIGVYEGDVWTHLFRINTDADFDMFNRDMDGNATSVFQGSGGGSLSLEYACFRCHADADKAEYSAITNYHTLGK